MHLRLKNKQLKIFFLPVVLELVLTLCFACDFRERIVIDNTQKQDTTRVEKCYKFGLDGIEEEFTLFIRGNTCTGSGSRFIQEGMALYRLAIKGSIENDIANVQITASNERKPTEQYIHNETWTFEGKKLYIRNRELESVKGNFEAFQINCKGSAAEKDSQLYDDIDGFYNGFAVALKDTNLMLLNRNEEVKFVLPSRFSGLEIVNENSIVYYDSEATKYGMLDTNGTILIQAVYEQLHCFNNGLAAFIGDEGKWGFLDRNGRIVIEPQFMGMTITDKIPNRHPFNDGLAGVMKDGKWGYINTKGETVIPFEYTYTSPFKDGEARVNHSSSEGWYVIDTSGRCIRDCP